MSHFPHALFSIFAQCGRFCSKICPTERLVPKIHAFKQQKWKYPFRQGLLPNRCLSFAPFPGYCTLFIFRPSNSCPFKIFFRLCFAFLKYFRSKFPSTGPQNKKKDQRNRFYFSDLFLILYISIPLNYSS